MPTRHYKHNMNWKLKLAKKKITQLLATAGITVNGNQPHDVQVHNPSFYQKVALRGATGLGESYVDGWWDCQKVDQLIYKVLIADLHKTRLGSIPLVRVLAAIVLNFQSFRRARLVGEHHYDLGNDLFEHMLDENMIYSCAYWKDAKTLEEAQKNKLDLIAHKLQFEKGMQILDVGCGWGSAARYFAERYGVQVTGITISKQQYTWACARHAGRAVTFHLQDYRQHLARYDAIYSIGMFEHVGRKNYKQFMQVMHANLEAHGRLLLHTIGTDYTLLAAAYYNSWINRNIFPNSELPSQKLLVNALEDEFMIDDWHNFGSDYDKTLMAWYQRFDRAYPALKERYDERFRRVWTYYLLVCAGAFRARHTQLWQLLLSPVDTTRRLDQIPACR